MTEGLLDLVNNVPTDDLDLFSSKTKSTLTAKKYVEKVSVDFSWVDEIYESIPYIDNIIRNPRRFITQEEDVIRIEKVKKVSEESIKHLAQHTSLIQKVDKDGTVKPLKLLNIFKEETIDLYENRFIYSLITNLNVFIQGQLIYKDEESFNKEVKTVNYEAQTRFEKEDITIKLLMRSANYENLTISSEKAKDLKEKLNYIADILDDFMSSIFMKTMKNATPVRSPIRKTNIILKDVNFIYALKLWEFLEGFQVETPLKKYKETIDLANNKLDNNYALTYYLNYYFLNDRDRNENDESNRHAGLKKIIFDTAKDFDNDEMELRKLLNIELRLAAKYKQDQIKGINLAFKDFIDNHNKKMNEALFILK
ncbi:MAG: DUF2357 domain-containing protein [Bacilli bacterium]|nr:DUF2357 domain-containing protein [Bacilli bacterium]